ncbi:CheR family methyltransferase, partial [Herbaspirillum sp. B65]
MKTLPHIADLLKAAMGLDMATVGSSLIERVVRERMAALEITDDSLYLAVLQTSETELQALIESAVVPETWFFRDREAIFATARLARQRLAEQPAVPVRILSLPCSTGEEPYSLAMALQEEGVAPTQFVIDAYDIRTRSLEIAAAGVYGRNSFRGQDLGFRDRHFT